MILRADARTRQVVVSPVLTGDKQSQLDQRLWFFALYADKGINDVLSAAYENRMLPALMQFGMVKREYLGPLWDVADGLGLVDVLKSGMRITVPYYRISNTEKAGSSKLKVAGSSHKLIRGQSVSHLAIQQQLLAASGDMQQSMAREAFKNLTAAQAASIGGDAGALVSFIGKVAANATSAAETRNWLLLPNDIRVRRIALPPGKHKVSLESQVVSGKPTVQHTDVDIKKGQMAIWKVRSFAHNGDAPVLQAGLK